MLNYSKGQWTVAADSYGKVRHSRKDCVFALDMTGKTVGPTVAHAIANHDDADLIVSAVNGCISVNTDNPQLVAESIKDMYEALKSLQSEIRASLKFDVKKHYSLMLADVATSKAIAKVEGK
jgi:hypothetical protein